MSDPEIQEADVRFDARDGYSLSGRSYVPATPKAAVLVSSGTGFPKEFYARIARQGAARGYACLTYDYRGIAGSAPATLRGFRTSIVEWGRQDFSAALDQAQALAPGRPVFTLGHSVGGHLVGFADNALVPAGHAFVCVGSGYWGGHDPGYRPNVLFFWLAYGPACLALKGYLPAGGLWGGTALPKGIFTEWRRWAFKPGYFGEELDALAPHRFAALTAPVRSWIFSDDRIATRKAASDILALYSQAPSELVELTPADIGRSRVDHQGAFRRGAEAFWPKPFNWFDQVLSGA